MLSSFDTFNKEELWRTPETTWSDSFNTAPADSEPDEWIIDNTTKQRNTKPELDINMVQPDADMQPPVVTNELKLIKLKINPPKPFSGRRDEFDKFLQDVTLYLELNDEIYDSNKKKIAYTLSFMNDGDAAAWKSQYLTEAKTPTGLNLTGLTQFQTDLQTVWHTRRSSQKD